MKTQSDPPINTCSSSHSTEPHPPNSSWDPIAEDQRPTERGFRARRFPGHLSWQVTYNIQHTKHIIARDTARYDTIQYDTTRPHTVLRSHRVYLTWDVIFCSFSVFSEMSILHLNHPKGNGCLFCSSRVLSRSNTRYLKSSFFRNFPGFSGEICDDDV